MKTVTITAKQALSHIGNDWDTAAAKAVLAQNGWASGEQLDDAMERPALELLADGGSLDDTIEISMEVARANGFAN